MRAYTTSSPVGSPPAKAELKLANDELTSRREAAQAASKLDDAALEQTREAPQPQ